MQPYQHTVSYIQDQPPLAIYGLQAVFLSIIFCKIRTIIEYYIQNQPKILAEPITNTWEHIYQQDMLEQDY